VSLSIGRGKSMTINNKWDPQGNEKDIQKLIKQDEYQQMVNQVKPKPSIVKNVFMAFLVGGSICVIGQILINYFSSLGLNKLDAGSATAAVLIFLAALCTGLGIFDSLGKHAGAGTIVPITGFANAMVASALEYKKEGYVLGVGAKLFTIAGPVLVFGIFTSWVVGLLYYLFF
jgi:stage V sporulation protein AC